MVPLGTYWTFLIAGRQDRGVDDWQRLADFVVARRVELGDRTATAFAKRSGLHLRIVGAIERVERTNYDQATLRTLELGLEWEPGSVRRVLRGLSPMPRGFVAEGARMPHGDSADVRPLVDASGWFYHRPSGVSDEDWEAMKAIAEGAMEGYIRARGLEPQ